MKAIHIYLNFDGNTREAMKFYADCLGAELTMQSYKDAGVPGPPGPPGSEDRIVHARLSKGSIVVMASDSPAGMPVKQGNNFWASVDCESQDEIEKLFGKFGDGATVVMELRDTFWNAHFGMLTDKYGVGWMFNFEKPKA
ncbi:MAG: VOC family protein [Gemmatimonadales bacterium]